MNWNQLTQPSDLKQALELSYSQPVLLFKHSTRCSISSTALARLERSWTSKAGELVKPFYLDLINHREISNEIAQTLGIVHESPQALVVVDGQCVYHASHLDIRVDDMVQSLKATS